MKTRLPGNLCAVRTPENVEKVRMAMLRSSLRSAQSDAAEFQTSCRDVRRIFLEEVRAHGIHLPKRSGSIEERWPRKQSETEVGVLTTITGHVLAPANGVMSRHRMSYRVAAIASSTEAGVLVANHMATARPLTKEVRTITGGGTYSPTITITPEEVSSCLLIRQLLTHELVVPLPVGYSI
ncbi:hypothetical protein AVEN_214121-1 [Araneus ventricosus]|uniref:DUF4817 domain-containing protein n=1 Tax=Araneus ventricosus TaxID=182803 RepID=A0A4Y2C6H6_ARAVE|nr:hypothetical protein AVEN_214121-1 [Araneus ventricosus]